jgi:ferritin-like metal-binding protein YciE
MDGNNGSPMVGFDSQSFWQDANAVLARGTREMLINARDKDGLVAAYDRMDVALGELVSKTAPPESVKEDLNHKLNDRISLVGKMMKASNIDARIYWEADMKSVAMVVLKALGKTRNQVFRIDKIVEDAEAAICEGNFTKEGAGRLLAELSVYNCKELKSLFAKLEDTPSHMEFLELVCEKGTKKARMMAEKAKAGIMPQVLENKPKPLARVIQMPMLAIVRQPLRHA